MYITLITRKTMYKQGNHNICRLMVKTKICKYDINPNNLYLKINTLR